MSATADDLRRELRDLLDRRGRGDVREKDFQRRQADLSVLLARAVVSERLPVDEPVLAEHHLVHSHFKLTESLLAEPEQATVSLFATERRVLRMRGAVRPGRAVTCDAADGTLVDELAYARIRGLAPCGQWRWGEALVGTAVVLLAVLFGDLLAVTGRLLVLLGAAGALHALLLPTRWIEIVTRDQPPDPPFAIHGIRRKSAKVLLGVLRRAIASGLDKR
jgi:hypothetical protein